MNQPKLWITHLEELLAQEERERLRDALVALLEHPRSAARLRELDSASLLTQIIPELEPARTTDQPGVHFLPVLAHSIEAVAAVDWLFAELNEESGTENREDGGSKIEDGTVDASEKRSSILDPLSSTQESFRPDALPVAVQTHPGLRYRSAYAAKFRARFAEQLEDQRPRLALFKLATLLHDVAKPQTKQVTPDGDVSFYEHQTIGGAVARAVALRLHFSATEAAYIELIVREHMRPGQLSTLDEVTLRAVRRFFHGTREAGPDVLLHSLADHMATRGPNLHVAAWWAQAQWTDALLDTIWGAEVELTRPLLNGNELMQDLGIPPGPLVGQLLAAIGEAQAGGDITTRADALALAQRLFRQQSAPKRK